MIVLKTVDLKFFFRIITLIKPKNGDSQKVVFVDKTGK